MIADITDDYARLCIDVRSVSENVIYQGVVSILYPSSFGDKLNIAIVEYGVMIC